MSQDRLSKCIQSLLVSCTFYNRIFLSMCAVIIINEPNKIITLSLFIIIIIIIIIIIVIVIVIIIIIVIGGHLLTKV